MERPEEKFLAGCCGIFCGLCPKFQSQAPSRCHGCQLGEQHSYCSIYRCCVIKRGFFTCADCEDCPCERILRVLGVEEGLDSFVSHRPALANLKRIKDAGLETYLDEQKERRLLLEDLLAGYNEGRSMSFYCRACTLMPPNLVRQAVGRMEKLLTDGEINGSDIKSKAKTMRLLIQELASEAGIELALRKKPEVSV